MKYILISVLLYALNNFFWKKYLKTFHPFQLMTGRASVTSTLAVILMERFDISMSEFIYSWSINYPAFILCNLLGAAGLYGLVKGLKQSSLQTFAFYTAISSLLAAVVLSFFQRISPVSVFGVLMLLTGLFTYTGLDIKNMLKSSNMSRYFLIMITGFTAASFITWHLTKTVHPTILMLNQEFTIFAIFGMMYLFTNALDLKSFIQNSPNYLLAGTVISMAVFFGLLGLRDTDPLIVTSLSSFIPIFTGLAGVVIMHERLDKRSMIALSLLIGGVLIFQYS